MIELRAPSPARRAAARGARPARAEALPRALLLALPLLLFASPASAGPAARPYAGFLLSHADPVGGPVLSAHLLTFPPALIAQAAFPIAGRFAGVATAGYSWFPGEAQGALGSGLLRAEIARPTEEKWGVVLLAGWIGGATTVRGDFDAASISGLQLVASSPVRALRLHAGAALHTMPGQSYDSESGRSETYDFGNPQPSLFLSGDFSTRRVRFQVETMWFGIGADEGWDSSILALGGVEVPVGRALLRFATGVYVGSPVTSGSSGWPVPPLVSVAVPLSE